MFMMTGRRSAGALLKGSSFGWEVQLVGFWDF